MPTTNSERVLEFLWLIRPEGATGSQIREATRLEPPKQVVQILRHLQQVGAVYADGAPGDAIYYARVPAEAIRPPLGMRRSGLNPAQMNAAGFEKLARAVLSARFGATLEARCLPGFPLWLGLVSADGGIAGEIKFLSLGRGERLTRSQAAGISESVWLLEKTGAPARFIVFGNDKRVPRQWLEQYEPLVANLSLFFMTPDGGIEVLY